ncbi:MAG: sigma-70 family RNA polymerase sigma factor [Anaerolineales bacterium]|nr:sigma-70 family RNA polymerase sigma factor [Anaerolineales bacterium]MBP6208859.1 sigma-70 family RNA polymerase sigma factor [Anaerolineales bacterium]
MVTNFHEIYQTYAGDVYRFVYWLCGNAQDAEDITSETFVRALTAGGEVRAETVKGYLLTIAKNLTYKSSNREKRFVPLQADFLDSQAGPSQLVEQSMSLQSAMQFIQILPDVDRAALVLRIQNDLPYEEIAGILGISLTAAKVKVHRSRLKLTEYMHQQEEPHS